jgi:hypothetical protein
VRPRRLWPLLAAVALLLAWHASAPDRATHSGAPTARRARPAPSASAQRAPSHADPDRHPAALPFGARSTGIAVCDDYVERALACAQLPDDARIAIAEVSKAWAETGASERPALASSCRETAAVQGDALAAMGC